MRGPLPNAARAIGWPALGRSGRSGPGRGPAVVAAHGRYYQQACSRPTRSEFVEELSRAYAEALTAQQLQDSIAFYSSDTGRALVDAHRRAAAAIYDGWTRINSKYLADLAVAFREELRGLSADK